MTDAEYDAIDPELKAIALLRLLRRPLVRRWAARTLGYPETGPLSLCQLAAWCGVHETTILKWERQALINLRGACRRSGLTAEAVDNLKHY